MYSVVFVIFDETNCFFCCTGDTGSDIFTCSTLQFTEILVQLLLVDIFGFFWFCKLGGVVALAMCFACIVENVMFFNLQSANDEAMITWCFCSAETSGINESVLDVLAAEYVVDLIMLCYYFCQIFGMNSFVFPWSYVSSFVLTGCVADEKFIIAQKSTRCCPLLFRTPRVKLPMQLSLACFLLFFPTVEFQSPVKNTSDLFLRWLRTVLTSLQRLSQKHYL